MHPLILLILVEAASASFNATLNPRDTTCSTPSGIGTCIPTTSCSGTSVPGYCPGASNIQCCVRTCKTPLGSGFCDNKANTCTGGAYVPNYCPGATDIQCCVASCNTGSATGSCAWTGSSCGNAFVPNFCPGPNDVQCCPSSVAKSSTAAGISVTKTETEVDSPPAVSTGKSLPADGNGAAGTTAAGTTSPAHTGTAGSPQPSNSGGGDDDSTPIADANSSAGSPKYPGNPSSQTTASKNANSNVKTGGSGNGATDSPSPSGLGSGSSSGSGSAAPRSPKHISSGAIAGLIIGLLALAAIAGSVFWTIRKKKREGQGHQIQEITEGPARVVGRRIGHELEGSVIHEVGHHPSQPPPAYAQELYSREIYEMRGHKQ